MSQHTRVAVVCFFTAPLIILGAGFSSHWIDAGNHGVHRYFGPRTATICEDAPCRSFAYSSEIRRLRRVSKDKSRAEGESRFSYLERLRKTARQLRVVEVQNTRTWRLTAALVVIGLIFAILGGMLLGLRRSVAWTYRLPTIGRFVGCGVAIVGSILVWILVNGLAKGIAHEERFISWGYAFYLGQLGLIIGGIGGFLAGSRPSLLDPPSLPASEVEDA